ncbi:ATP-binding protein [Streptomyces sp. t39]|uniref:sensor histidine kinase n=1 Tax=Streptomyces sp. t39 TaxID=1828156 RepID=UPI0011CD4304|nr:ATP-binding protein [Streptomyces sp. t39]TXS56974.1 PAS domain-containing protein [Streptomyces sp. t39]
MRLPRPRSLAGQLFAMQVVLVAAIVAGCALFAYVTDQAQAEESARHRTTATAAAAARSPSVAEAARSGDPSAVLQPYAEALRKDAGMDFVVIMDPHGRRWTHPTPERIGETYLGHIGPAQRGGVLSEQFEGTLGLSVRTVAPVRDAGGRVVAIVSAGITVEEITQQVREQVTALLVAAGAALALGGAGTYVINARLRRHTHGMNSAELGRMHDYHQAALHAVREGLVMLDGGRRIALANDGARELLGLGDDAVGRPVAELGLPAPLTGALLASEPRVDEVHLTADRIVVVNTRPVVGGEQRGTVVTLRDHTELQALSGELDSERGFTQALRSQAHEAANRLHTVVSLIELGRADEAVDFATAELELAQVLTDRVVGAVGEPVLAALLLGKTAQANERGVELVLTEDSRIDDHVLPDTLPPRDLVTVLGNLIDNAVDAAAGLPGPGPATTGPALATAPLPAPAGVGFAAPAGAAEAGAAHGCPAGAGRHGSPEAAGDGPAARPGAGAAEAGAAHGAAGPGHHHVPVPGGGPEAADGRGRADAGSSAPSAAALLPAQAGPPGGAAPAVAAPGGVRARVTVTLLAERDELLVRVADSGPGVSPDRAEDVFRRGWSTHGPGRGIGLALVQQAVRRGQGTVAVGRGADGGAEFTVRLPLITAGRPAPDRPTETRA